MEHLIWRKSTYNEPSAIASKWQATRHLAQEQF